MKKQFKKYIFFIAISIFIYTVFIGLNIYLYSRNNEIIEADAAIVLGAAVWEKTITRRLGVITTGEHTYEFFTNRIIRVNICKEDLSKMWICT